MFSVTNQLRTRIANDLLLKQRGAAVFLGRRITSTIWDNRDSAQFSGFAGYQKGNKEIDRETEIDKHSQEYETFLKDPNFVQFLSEDITSNEKSEELVKRVYEVVSRIEDFNDLYIKSGIYTDFEGKAAIPKKYYFFRDRLPDIDPGSRLSLTLQEGFFVEKITQTPLFSERVTLGESFISPELHEQIEDYFAQLNESVLQQHQECTEYCKQVLAKKSNDSSRSFKYLASPNGEKETAASLIFQIQRFVSHIQKK